MWFNHQHLLFHTRIHACIPVPCCSNMVSWMLAGMVDYHINLGRHFAYPHMIIDGGWGECRRGWG